MLIRLKMVKWRKHVDRTIDFTTGLNAIRGANENGKSSMLWAIAYALWGAKVLPLPMEEMVTWGHQVKEAKVDLIMSIGGELYNFVRGPNGAECRHSGGVVTGQNEVSKFSTEMLGVNADMAMKLMFAPQGDLRGALQAGPSGISNYIEDMSGMDLFERLMEVISEKLTTGPTTTLDNAIAGLQEQLEAGGPKEPDTSDIKNKIADLGTDLRASETKLVGAEIAATTANNAYTTTKAKADVREATLRNLNRAEVNRDRRLEQKENDRVAAAVEVDEARIPELERLITNGTELEAQKQAYKAFSALPAMEVEWEGDESSLKAAIAVEAAKVNTAKESHTSASTEIRVLESQLVTSSVCGFCDQDMSKFPEVAKKNAELQGQIDAKKALLEPALEAMRSGREDHNALVQVLDGTEPSNLFLRKYGNYVEADHNFVPPRITWKGAVPQGDSNTATLTAEVKVLKTKLATKTAAATRLAQVEIDLEQDERTIAELKASVGDEVDIDALYNAKFAADTKVADLTKAIRRTREDMQVLESNKSRLLAEFEVAKRNFAQVSVTLAEKKAQRDDLMFNNTLVKKIKAARPIVAGKLWALVLTSVSVLFSNMRGEQSVVTKGVKGFLVNGRPSEGLSGSALDLLGFAIRVAMLNTFIPQCSFLILDEATSACDDDRTASMLGFIASAGFPQTLLVTHEAASESVADNVVMI